MFVRSGEIHIARACATGAIDREPALHVFFDAHVPWVTLGDTLSRYDRDHAGLAKYRPIPNRLG